MIACLLAFFSGSLVATVAALLYSLHVERVHHYTLRAARSAGYNDGLLIGRLQPMREVRA